MPGHRPASARLVAVVASAAPTARHGIEDNTGTLAPASAPAPSNWPAVRRTAAIARDIARISSMMAYLRVTSVGKNSGLTKAAPPSPADGPGVPTPGPSAGEG